MTETSLLRSPNNELPPLPDYHAEPVPPALRAAYNGPDLADLYIHVGGDGLPLALAALKNGHGRPHIAAEWARIRDGLTAQSAPTEELRAAAVGHFGAYLDLSTVGAKVNPGVPDQPALDYARDVLYTGLRRPARPDDTDVRLSVPYPYYVPGSRFDDPFPADNAQVEFALLADGHIDESLKTLANDQYNTMRFGYSPNLSAIGMGRQQTPLDSFAIEAFRGLYGDQVLQHFLPALERNLAFMGSGKETLAHVPLHEYGAHRRIVRLPGGLHAYRNWDDTPVDYKTRSVIRIESAERDRSLGEERIAGIQDEDERAAAWVEFQVDLGAAAESWQDMADYQLADWHRLVTTRTTQICTPWMQAAVAHKLRMAAEAHESLGNYAAAERRWAEFNELKEVVNGLMWKQVDETHGHPTDILLNGEQTGALNAAQILPLLVGGDFISYERSLMTIRYFEKMLLGKYGLHTSDIEGCPEQWSGDRAWMSLAILAKLAAMEQARQAKARGNPHESPEPFIEFAEKVQAAAVAGVDAWHAAHQTFPERVNGTDPTKIALGGEYCSLDKNGKEPEPQIGFGMTAGGFIVASTVDLRHVFDNIEHRRGTWLQQMFAVHLGRSVVGLAA